ncbi:GNAT family N-acetyltransferase [Brevibacillus sp. H7]|uniref:GNAT family N-acetyltransferase n=1 Tax=Brevibacillus sp. H7 TaxID=3349138 RepID=UPI00381E1E94
MLSPFPAASRRLTFSPVTEADFPALLTVYSSNPDYMEMSEGTRIVSLETVEKDHRENLELPDSFSVAIREQGSADIIGISQFILRNPNDGFPWLGLIMLHSARQQHGYAREFMETLIEWYRENGYEELRLGVLEKNRKVVPFYERLGFFTYEVKQSEKLGRVICMARKLTGGDQ